MDDYLVSDERIAAAIFRKNPDNGYTVSTVIQRPAPKPNRTSTFVLTEVALEWADKVGRGRAICHKWWAKP